LKGPALAAYYPRKTVSFRDLQDTYKPLDLETFDEGQDDREEAIQMYVGHVIILWKIDELELTIWRITARNYVAKGDQRRRELLQVSRNRIHKDAPRLSFANQLDVFANLFTFIQNHDQPKRRNKLMHAIALSACRILFYDAKRIQNCIFT
jgi:hypothetical protein